MTSFGVEFDFAGLLPPDHVEHGFDKFGEAHLMSPHQVMAYLKTARFVAERVLPDAKPKTRTWEFDVRHFHGSKNFATGGGGDYRDGEDYVLTGFRPYRSNLHFSIDPESHKQFAVPAFGVYRLEVKAHSEKSNEGEVIGINLGRRASSNQLSDDPPDRLAAWLEWFYDRDHFKGERPTGLHLR